MVGNVVKDRVGDKEAMKEDQCNEYDFAGDSNLVGELQQLPGRLAE